MLILNTSMPGIGQGIKVSRFSPTFDAVSRSPRTTDLQRALASGTTTVFSKLDSGSSVTIRDLANAAFFAIATGSDTKSAERALHVAFETQKMDDGVDEFGVLPWQINGDTVKDKNSIEFGTEAIGPLLLGYGGNLSGGFKEWLKPHIVASFNALRKHKVPVSYTNIYLMKTTNLILMGMAVGDQAAKADGEKMLDTWIAYTRQSGIHEFDSPTYYSTDLHSLYMLYIYATDETRAKAKACLDYICGDIAANYFPYGAQLSGPHSRDYDFLDGGGGLDLFLFLEGLRQKEHLTGDVERVYDYINCVSLSGYHPNKLFYTLAQQPFKEVQQIWDENGRQRYNYITPDFSLGSASGNYGPQDKMIAMEFASEAKIPTMSIIPDSSGEPYGKNKKKDKSGHSKPIHYPLSPTVSQRNGSLLALLQLDTAKAKDVNDLTTNLIVPSGANLVVLDGQEVTLKEPTKIAAHVGSVLGVLVEKTAFVVHVFEAESLNGHKAEIALQSDEVGLKGAAARLSIYHYKGHAEKLDAKILKVGFLMVASHCESPAEFKEKLKGFGRLVEQKNEGSLWTVTALTPDGKLEVTADRQEPGGMNKAAVAKESKAPKAPLIVNGQDHALRI